MAVEENAAVMEEEVVQEQAPEADLEIVEPEDDEEEYETGAQDENNEDGGDDESDDDLEEQLEGADDEGDDEDEDGDDDESAGLDDAILERAANLGLTREEAEAFETPEALERTLGILEKRLPQDDGVSGSEAEAGENDAQEGFELEFEDEALYEPELIDNLRGMKTHYDQALSAMRQEVEQLRSANQANEAQAVTERFERMISDLGDDYEPMLGKGTVDDIDRSGDHFKNRQKLFEQMHVIQSGRVAAKLEPLAEKELFQQAVNHVFNGNLKDLTRKGIAKTLKKRKGQMIGRPQGRKGRPLSPDQAAYKAVADKLKSLGGSGEEGDPDEFFD
jgi:hypothetical protein